MKTHTLLLAAATAAVSLPAFAQDGPPPHQPEPPRPPQQVAPMPPPPPPPGAPLPPPPHGKREGDRQPRPYLGVITAPLPPALAAQLGLAEGFGLLVEEILPKSPAAAAGLQEHDIIKSFNDQQLVNPDQFAALVRREGKDAQVSLVIVRKGQEQKVAVKLAERTLPEPGPGGRLRWEKHLRDEFPRLERLRDDVERNTRRLREDAMDRAKRLRDELPKVEQLREEVERKTQRLREEAASGAEKARQWGEHLRENIGRGAAELMPEKVLREQQPPGSTPHVEIIGDDVATSWGAGDKIRLKYRDDHGEMEVAAENGDRTLVAKDPKGAVVFNGPINTEDQVKAVPEEFRKKLLRLRFSKPGAEGQTPAADVLIEREPAPVAREVL